MSGDVFTGDIVSFLSGQDIQDYLTGQSDS